MNSIFKPGEDLTYLDEFMPAFEISSMILIFDSVSNLNGSWNTGWLQFVTFQSYRHMEELLIKIVYLICYLLIKKSTQLFYSRRFLRIWYKLFHICSFKLMTVSRYLGGQVVWYLKRWPGFHSQPELVLLTVNAFQLIIPFFNF